MRNEDIVLRVLDKLDLFNKEAAKKKRKFLDDPTKGPAASDDPAFAPPRKPTPPIPPDELMRGFYPSDRPDKPKPYPAVDDELAHRLPSDMAPTNVNVPSRDQKQREGAKEPLKMPSGLPTPGPLTSSNYPQKTKSYGGVTPQAIPIPPANPILPPTTPYLLPPPPNLQLPTKPVFPTLAPSIPIGLGRLSLPKPPPATTAPAPSTPSTPQNDWIDWWHSATSPQRGSPQPLPNTGPQQQLPALTPSDSISKQDHEKALKELETRFGKKLDESKQKDKPRTNRTEDISNKYWARRPQGENELSQPELEAAQRALQRTFWKQNKPENEELPDEITS